MRVPTIAFSSFLLLGVFFVSASHATGQAVLPQYNVGQPSAGRGFDDGTWTELSLSSPPPGRYFHTAIFDPVRDRMVVFGGLLRNDVWALTFSGLEAWGPLTPEGGPPSGRQHHTAIHDPLRDRMVVFGGWDGVHYLNDVWTLTFSGTPVWSQMTLGGQPPDRRESHTAIYDPVRDRMVVFGGYNGVHFNDVWTLSFTGTPAWNQLIPAGAPPSSRQLHTAIYDPERDRMVVYGGHPPFPYDVWALTLSETPTWSQLAPEPEGSSPTAVMYHAAIYDAGRDRMLVFGGDGGSDLAKTWALDFSGNLAWRELAPAGIPPSGRNAPTAIYDPTRERMVVFGGLPGYFDTWALRWAPEVIDSGHATGAAWVDLDGDSDLDLHILRTQGEADLVYENQGGGMFAPFGSPSPLGDPGNGQGMDWGDYDNDGDLDLYLVNTDSANKLFRNDGSASFVDVTTPPLDYGCCDEGVVWIDYDRDGLLDLYLTTGSAQPNRLFRNLGGSFAESTPPALAITSRCATSAWGDYDFDGDSDVYVSVVDGPDHLVRNDGGGSFVDVTTPPLDDQGMGQGAAWGDYDNDGDLDLYLCNFGQPNRLFRNDGGSFVDVATGPLADASQGQSGTWADFDNDRDLDLALTNFGQPSYMLRNDGGASFVPIAALGDSTHSISAAWGDIDTDGDEDLLIANFGSSAKLFRSPTIIGNHWLEVTLRGTTSNHCAIGTRIIVSDLESGVTQMREHGSNHGFWSCNAPAEHFGLGSSTQVDLLIVRWPSGSLQSFQNVPANQRITIVEGGGIVGVPDLPASPLRVQARPNPFRDRVQISWSSPSRQATELEIFNVMGRLVRSFPGTAGDRTVILWDGRDGGGQPLGSGVYFYRVRSGNERLTGKLLKLR